MNVIDLTPNPDNIIVCGDIHGKFEELVHTVTVMKKITDAVVIVAGDCGLGFHKPTYYEDLYQRKLHRKLSTVNILLLMVRGNHDDPAYYSQQMIDFPYWKSVPDYAVLQAQGHNILCVGGAISVDRSPRIAEMGGDRTSAKGKLPIYWADEAARIDAMALEEITQSGIKIDTVITHTAPDFCPPLSKFGPLIETFRAQDPTLEDDVTTERQTMTRLLIWLTQHNHPLKNWYYGHFHASAFTERDGIGFHLLNIMELKELL